MSFQQVHYSFGMSDYTPSNVDLAITLITHTTVTGVLYTFSFILYCLCTRLLYKQLSEKFSRHTIFMFALASIMAICATIDVVVKNEYGRIIYVDYSSVPGGPIGLSAQAHAFTLLRIDTVSTLIASFLAMGVLVSRHSFYSGHLFTFMQVRRVWVVYIGVPSCFSIPVIILASLVYVAYVGKQPPFSRATLPRLPEFYFLSSIFHRTSSICMGPFYWDNWYDRSDLGYSEHNRLLDGRSEPSHHDVIDYHAFNTNTTGAY
jgi:hypothetical protein